MILTGLLSGCAYNSLPVLNNVAVFRDGQAHPTLMVISDNTGVINQVAKTGSFVWVPQNTFVGYNGIGYNVGGQMTARFYDASIGPVPEGYLGATNISYWGGYGNYNGWGWSYLYGQFIVNSITQPTVIGPVYNTNINYNGTP